MPTVISAHQPNFIPYLGFFDKMKDSDVFVVRDEVQFTERDWHHRNMIRIQGSNGNGSLNSKWVTLPVEKSSDYIKDIRIKKGTKVKNVPYDEFISRQIRSSYSNAPYFKAYFPGFESVLKSGKENLLDVNMDIIYFLMDAFGIKTEVVKASSLPYYNKNNDPNKDLVDICISQCGDIYLSGAGGRNYLDQQKFRDAGIEVRFQDFKHPVYRQNYPGFLPNMCSIDALFNVGGFPE